MRAWRDGSRVALAARAATVLPVPTSPVITPRAASAMQWRMRATASSWGALVNSSEGARLLPKGVRVKPKWVCQGARSVIRTALLLFRAGRGTRSDPTPSPRGRPGPGRDSRSRWRAQAPAVAGGPAGGRGGGAGAGGAPAGAPGGRAVARVLVPGEGPRGGPPPPPVGRPQECGPQQLGVGGL